MPTSTDELIRGVLGLGHELPGVECKAAAPITNDWILKTTLKAMVGMSNLQDGGIVIIGIGERGNKLVAQGLSESDLKTWSLDALSAKAAPYFEPAIRFRIQNVTLDTLNYIAIEVEEFETYPTLVKKSLQGIDPQKPKKTKEILREGGCYVRARAKRETREVPTAEDMRELLDLAVQKGLNKWVKNARIAGLIASPAATNAAPSDSQYDIELGDL